MTKDSDAAKHMSSAKWRTYLLEGDEGGRWVRRLFRFFPASPRCTTCLAPFGNPGGKVLGLIGFAPSRKNPMFCKFCFESGPLGGAEVDVGVLFADLRGFTALSETQSPEDSARLLNRFYRAASDALINRGAVLDKLVGDQVMALFVQGLAGPNYIEKMADSVEDLLQRLGYGPDGHPWLPVGVGIDCGVAFVGNVGSGEVKDFTAIGDVVNTAARLQTQAQAGQIVMSERVFQQLAGRYPNARSVKLDLKGKSEPVPVRMIDLARTSAVA